MSVFDALPKRQDGTKITPWDDDWTNDVGRGVYEPTLWRDEEPKKRVFVIPDPIKTGEMVDPGLMRMFVKGAYRELFAKLYGD